MSICVACDQESILGDDFCAEHWATYNEVQPTAFEDELCLYCDNPSPTFVCMRCLSSVADPLLVPTPPRWIVRRDAPYVLAA